MPSTAHSRKLNRMSVCLRTKLGSVLHMRHATRVSRMSLFYRTSEGSTSALGRTESLRIALFGTFSPAFLHAHADVDKTETDTGIDTANHHRKNEASGIILYRYVFNRQARNTRCACTYAPTRTRTCARRCCIQALPVSVNFCMMPSRYTSVTRRFEFSFTVVPFVTHHMR
jgi:hypothetical protein